MRLKHLSAPGLTGALLSSTVLAAVPVMASADSVAPAAPAAGGATAVAPVAKVSSTLSVKSVRRTVIAGRRLMVRGVLKPSGAGRAVSLQLRNPGGWTTVAHDRTDARGRYLLGWRSSSTGTKQVRVHFGGTRDLTSARHTTGTARIYRRALASWYGPGLYGQHLACGGTLSAGTLGVAHKSLPCGTKVTLHYRGRTVRVPVVDRGPYVGAREFDLTAATKQKLGFGSTGTVLTTR
ncbi:MAG: rare lipoprotein [Baekduia sp.]|nr:rare lipoprotein [Baekduia sp.]